MRAAGLSVSHSFDRASTFHISGMELFILLVSYLLVLGNVYLSIVSLVKIVNMIVFCNQYRQFEYRSEIDSKYVSQSKFVCSAYGMRTISRVPVTYLLINWS